MARMFALSSTIRIVFVIGLFNHNLHEERRIPVPPYSKDRAGVAFQLPVTSISSGAVRGYHAHRYIDRLTRSDAARQVYGRRRRELAGRRKDQIVIAVPGTAAGIGQAPGLNKGITRPQHRTVRDADIADECGSVADLVIAWV